MEVRGTAPQICVSTPALTATLQYRTQDRRRRTDPPSPAASSTYPAGNTVVTAQQYFIPDGNWAARIARLSFC